MCNVHGVELARESPTRKERIEGKKSRGQGLSKKKKVSTKRYN